MLKVTRNTVIAFDFRDALSFEGETGPYVQYATVRAANILRKAGTDGVAAIAALASVDAAPYLVGATAAAAPAVKGAKPEPVIATAGDELWAMWLLASRVTTVLEQAIAAAEPAILARYAFQLAQEFSNFYHRNHVLNEADPQRRALLLATTAVAQRELARVLGWLGIAVPAAM